MKITKITKEIENLVISNYSVTHNQKKTSDITGIHKSTVGIILKRNGIKTYSYSELFGIDKNKELEIINYYLLGNSLKDCAKLFGYSDTTVWNILNRNQIDRRTNSKFSKLEVENIKNLYKAGGSLDSLSNTYRCHVTTIWNILRKNGYKKEIDRTIRTSNRRIYDLNEDYFSVIDTKDKAYFLGWLVSDGYNNGNAFSITLKYLDKYILELFKNKISYSGQLFYISEKLVDFNDKMYKRKAQYKLCISSKKACNDLINLGVVPNKSHKTYFPDISEHLWSHFIRGVFDGDGCITYNKGQLVFSITGNKELLVAIQKILFQNCGLNLNKIYKSKNSSVISFGGNKQAKRIYEYLYKDCENLYLIRKKEKWNL